MTDGRTAAELTMYLTCPRQYEFEYVSGLTGDRRRNQDRFRRLLREVICTGLTESLHSDGDPHAGAVAALDAEWPTYAGPADHHSDRQETAEKNRARAAVDAYFEAVGPAHREGIERAAERCESPVVGPDITLTATIEGQQVAVDVDYVIADGSRIVGVRLTDTMWGSKVPFETRTDVAEKHLEQGDYRPEQVGTVVAARIAEEALRRYGRGESGAELLYVSVMETTFESADGYEAEIDRRRMGDYLEDVRGTIDEAIAWIRENVDAGIYSPEAAFDRQDHWDGSFEQVVENACAYCPYAAGCQEAIRREVMFDV